MFTKMVSFTLILTLFLGDLARCMEPEDPTEKTPLNACAKRHSLSVGGHLLTSFVDQPKEENAPLLPSTSSSAGNLSSSGGQPTSSSDPIVHSTGESTDNLSASRGSPPVSPLAHSSSRPGSRPEDSSSENDKGGPSLYIGDRIDLEELPWTSDSENGGYDALPQDHFTNGRGDEKDAHDFASHQVTSSLPFATPSSGILLQTRKHNCLNVNQGDAPEGDQGALCFTITEDDLDPRVKAFLLHAHYLIEGKPTWRQVGIGAFGIPIGVGVGNGMTPIFFQSLKDLGPAFVSIIKNSDIATNLFIAHTVISLGTDSTARNVRILGGLAGPSTEEFAIAQGEKMKNLRRGLLVITYVGAGIAALLPIYYLWRSEHTVPEKNNKDRIRALAFFGCFAGTLWADSLLMIGRAVKNRIDAKFNDICINQAYANQSSTAYTLHEQELHRFRDLASIFRAMDDEEIQSAYARLAVSVDYKQQLAIEQKNLSDAYASMTYAQWFKSFVSDSPTIKEIKANIESLKMGEALRILGILHQIHQEKAPAHGYVPLEDPSEEVTSTTTLIGWGLPHLATIGRSYIFWYVVDELLGNVGLSYGVLRTSLSIVFGEILASLFQGAIEIDTVKQAAADLLFSAEKGDSSRNPWWKTCRIVGKGVSYIEGGWNSLPYVLVWKKITPFWPMGARILTVTPSVTADMLNNAVCFQESFGDIAWAIEKVAANYGKITPSYMRNTLIDLADKFYEVYNPIDPQVLTRSEAIFIDHNKTKINQPLNYKNR